MLRASIMAFVVVSTASACKQDDKAAKPPTEDKNAIAKLTVKKYAFEAFPLWTSKHPEKACPDRIDELFEYVRADQHVDPWGSAFRLMCGPSLPVGATGGVGILSVGADGKEGTADDIKSWE